MLNGDGTGNGSRSIDLISKNNLHLQHAFLSFFAFVLHDYNAVLYD